MSEIPFSVEAIPPKIVERRDPTVLEKLRNAPFYQKKREIHADIADGGEVIATKLADGSVETRNTAERGDAIVTNFGGEQYIISGDRFADLYSPKPGEVSTYLAEDLCKVIPNPWGQPIAMMASWGEMQSGDADCFIAVTFDDETGRMGEDPYIIGRQEFFETYRPFNPQ